MIGKLKELWNRWNVHVTVVGGVLVVAAAWGTCTYEPNLSTEVQEDVEEVQPVEDASTETTGTEETQEVETLEKVGSDLTEDNSENSVSE
tara:strand:+ start:204 stop:473 length:270 start_codon:yes stop_codon:yes gene_type:complete